MMRRYSWQNTLANGQARRSIGQAVATKMSQSGLVNILCPACQQRQDQGDLCLVCERYLDTIEQPCPNCAAPMLNEGRCGECLKHPPAWQAMKCSWHFTGLSRFLIHRFKYQRDFSAGQCLVDRWLLSHEQSLKPDALIAVPMHHKKQFDRGFNQALWLAENISKHWNIPIWQGAKRTEATAPLEGLSKKARQSALKGAFKLTERPPQHVAIIDDVFTSGATLTELTNELKKAGTHYVSAWTLARTPLG